MAKDLFEYGFKKGSLKGYCYDIKKYKNVNEIFFVVQKDKKIYAFSSKKNALIFAKSNGGKILNFKKTLRYVKNHRYLDKSNRYENGKNIYEKKCHIDTDFDDFLEVNELEAYLYKKCKNLSYMDLEDLAIYLWDKKRDDIFKDTIEVTKNDRCPVCKMYLYRYQDWLAQIVYVKNSKTYKYTFDGVKDMMKFYFNPKKYVKKEFDKTDIQNIYVTDFKSKDTINAKDAFYVIGSDVYGPMGDELIPFENKNEAEEFLKSHNVKKIIRFNEITLKLIRSLDV
jgi:nitrous oxide reductase accessory protein NosL